MEEKRIENNREWKIKDKKEYIIVKKVKVKFAL
jgi:hypothetical protein